jgi:hypothetical protein
MRLMVCLMDQDGGRSVGGLNRSTDSWRRCTILVGSILLALSGLIRCTEHNETSLWKLNRVIVSLPIRVVVAFGAEDLST